MNRASATQFGAIAIIGLLGCLIGSPASTQELSCSASAQLLRSACFYEIRDDFHENRARCLDDSTPDDACLSDSEAELEDGDEECTDIFSARLELCADLNDAAHEPLFGEAFTDNFVDPTEIGLSVIPNPYFPLVTDNRWVYESADEVITVVVSDRVKLIEGIPCVVVNDLVTEDGVAIEDTDDWYAQDLDGNVWYCGEIAENFETFEGDEPEEPELVDIEGSWKAGRDGAKAGLLLPFAPQPGTVIRQEVAWGDAEDVIEIVSITASEATTGGACAGDCLQTRDYTPLEPDVSEDKYYAPGIGMIVEVDPETGDRLELMLFANP